MMRRGRKKIVGVIIVFIFSCIEMFFFDSSKNVVDGVIEILFIIVSFLE